MAALISHIFSSASLFSLGIYHLISTTKNYLNSPRDFTAKPHHPLPSSPRFKHLQLHLLLLFLLLSIIHNLLISTDSDPLVKGSTPVYRFTSLQSAAVLFVFFLLVLSILVSETTHVLPFPNDVFFLVLAVAFALQFTVASNSSSQNSSGIQGKCESIQARIAGFSALLAIVLACNPKLFAADLALGASVCLQGLWVLQTGLSLYADGFIPEGCHRLLDVAPDVEGSTKCDLEESRLRAFALLDLVFMFHVIFVVIVALLAYGSVAKIVGIRRFGSYEALPTSSDSTNHIQMKSLNQA